jgi:hypothetical protein
MSRVPTDPYIVRVTYRVGEKLAQKNYNASCFSGAQQRKLMALSEPQTLKVEVLLIIDETTRKSEGQVVVDHPRSIRR